MVGNQGRGLFNQCREHRQVALVFQAISQLTGFAAVPVCTGKLAVEAQRPACIPRPGQLARMGTGEKCRNIVFGWRNRLGWNCLWRLVCLPSLLVLPILDHTADNFVTNFSRQQYLDRIEIFYRPCLADSSFYFLTYITGDDPLNLNTASRDQLGGMAINCDR